MNTYSATVRGRRHLSPHLVSISLSVDGDLASTGVPDEYLRLLIPPPGAELVLPEIGENYSWTYPEGVAEPEARVYTVSDHRIVDGVVQIDVDVALHDVGIGSDWARTCEPGDVVGLTDTHGLYKPESDALHQRLVCDITGVPALARILRGLSADHHVEAVVVVTDAADQVALPSAATVDVQWVVAGDDRAVSEELTRAVCDAGLTEDHAGRYVWLAGEARASRAARKHLRRELGWPQSAFYTCGYWQIDAETWNARYEEVSERVIAEAIAAHERADGDEGRYLDELDEIYEKAGL